MNVIKRLYNGADPRKVAAEELTDLDPRPRRVARYRDGCELTLEPGERAPDTCPGEGCNAGLAGVVLPDGGRRSDDRLVEDAHECIPETDQTSDVDRCQLCGGVIDE